MIQYLNSDAFGGQLRDPRATGVNPLFRAKIRIGDESVHCYVKPSPDKVWEHPGGYSYESAEIMSEALGYVLANVVGLPVAKNAGVIQLDRAQIPPRVQAALDAMSPHGPQQSYLAWFSQDTSYPNLYRKHVEGIPKFLAERRAKRLATNLAKDKAIPGIVAFDGWLQNSDRHLGNLLWAPAGYTLIDHGRIFIGPDWKPSMLPLRGDCQNRLKGIIDAYVPKWSQTLPSRSGQFLAYNSFAMAFREKGASAAAETLVNFLSDEGTAQVIDFLVARLDNDRYSKELGMLAFS